MSRSRNEIACGQVAGGGCSPHDASARRSLVMALPGRRVNAASTTRSRGPQRGAFPSNADGTPHPDTRDLSAHPTSLPVTGADTRMLPLRGNPDTTQRAHSGP
jgi:hypothetical protein